MTPIVLDTIHAPASPADMLARLPREPFRVLLESQSGPADIARYSFLVRRPFALLQSRARALTLWQDGERRRWEGDPLEAMESLLTRFAVKPDPALPLFTGGAIGFFSYDLGRQIERLPATACDDLSLPEMWLAFYDHLIAFDHHTDQAFIVMALAPGREKQAEDGARELAELARLPHPLPPSPSPKATERGEAPGRGVRLSSNFTRADYCRAVEHGLEYIRAGHIYQVNLSQRFTAPVRGEAESLYHRLRAANPAPFAAFLDAGEFQIVSASPERFLQFDPVTRRVETRPIKGTRQRGVTPEEDERLKAELLASEKDAAELVMIVDLERNDLGRVCDYGTVRVPDLRRVEGYPTVWHTVATVEGRLRPAATRADLLRAAFPGGSITGAPKIRSMQIIEELESLRRHVYCGAIGYLGFDGRMDLNIAIRTITIVGDQAYFHAGGGIVADSDPKAEYEETLHKARALAGALGFSM
ncbi:MAG: aminodeoxychorismate synthase component I [Chloroflexi bacterium]|nr:aminodeoxychorismate synthase component I [Chloroflexota bacterium]